MRGLAVLATGALLWGFAAGPASADSIRDGEWALQKYGATTSVWPISQGDGVIVAVIDSGVGEHQDLKDQVLPGADFPSGSSPGRDDTEGHGTGMASVIAARGHDGESGAIGLAPKAKILPIKVDLTGEDAHNNVASAIRFAVDHGAKVINMSIGTGTTPGAGTAERDAIKYAIDKDVVLVSATGNEATNVTYPAAYPGVVAVAAIGQDGSIWPKSNFGPQVTLVAPGVDIYHADPISPTGYSKGTGTSDSSAFVSAISALVRSKYPNLSAGQVINRMIKSAAAPPDKSAVPNEHYGYGIASPSRALQPNPEVDNGSKANPLASRPDPYASSSPDQPSGSSASAAAAPTGNSAAASKSGSKAMLFAVGGGVLVLVIIVIVVLVSRRSRNGGGGGNGGHGGGPGGSGGGYPYPPQGQPGPQGYQQQYPPQGYPQQQFPPQPPQPPQGNPYQR